jgi:putative membrane protein
LLWALLVVYAAARVSQGYPETVPMLWIVGLHVMAPLAFALIHGGLVYRLRGILVFTFLCFAVGNLFENLSVLTGFPFGRYHFTDVMGPKILQVPILLGLAYVGMGYVAWTTGRLLLGDLEEPLRGWRVCTRPMVAAFVMVAWDLSMDPTWANLVHGWKWREGGAYFGVPVSNFLGWYLTVYSIYQLFALYLRRRRAGARPLPLKFWRLPVLFYAVSAAGNLLVSRPAGISDVTDAAGTRWKVDAIFAASALVSIFVMGAFAAIAWVRLSDRSDSRPPGALASRANGDA